MQTIFKFLGVIWALPYTLLGLLIGGIGLCTGGQVRRSGCVFEFHGGATKWFVSHLPHGQFTLAFTLGHTILGQSNASLDISRDHEMVHVRQFERWGPFMGPAYLLSSLVLWMAGRRPYRDNPFAFRFLPQTYKPVDFIMAATLSPCHYIAELEDG